MTHPTDVRLSVLTSVQRHGSVSRAAREAGVGRNTVYAWADQDASFARELERARTISREVVQSEVLQKAMAATGHVVEVPLTDDKGRPVLEQVLDQDGEPVIDDDTLDYVYRQATRQELRFYDSRILSKLIDKMVPGEVQRVDARNINAEVTPEQVAGDAGVRVVLIDTDGNELETGR